MIKIRKARLADASALFAIAREVSAVPGFLASEPDEITLKDIRNDLKRLTKGPGCYYVAESKGKLIGYGYLSPMPLRAVSHVFRLTVVVVAAQINKGVGSRLLQTLLEWTTKDPKVEKVELNIRASNQRALHVYQKFGFFVEGRLRWRARLPSGELVDELVLAWFPKMTNVYRPRKRMTLKTPA